MPHWALGHGCQHVIHGREELVTEPTSLCLIPSVGVVQVLERCQPNSQLHRFRSRIRRCASAHETAASGFCSTSSRRRASSSCCARERPTSSDVRLFQIRSIKANLSSALRLSMSTFGKAMKPLLPTPWTLARRRLGWSACIASARIAVVWTRCCEVSPSAVAARRAPRGARRPAARRRRAACSCPARGRCRPQRPARAGGPSARDP